MGLAQRLAAANNGNTAGAAPNHHQQQQQQQQQYQPPPPSSQQQQQQQQHYGQQPQGAYGQQPQGGYGGGQDMYGAPPAYSNQSGYPTPQGGKTSYAPPPGPPPPVQGNRPMSQYAPPSGPPPPLQGSSYPGQAPSSSQPYSPQYGAPSPQQQQTYGAPTSSSSGSPARDFNTILRLLQATVQDQHIEAFYPPGSGRLEQVAQQVVREGKLERVAGEWRMPLEIAMDLAKLALFDIILYCDDSGSMQFEEGGSRIDDLKLIVQRCAYAASLFDDDGIQVRFMNSRVEGNGIRTDQDALALLGQVRYSGLTPLGTSLDQKVLQPLLLGPARAGALQKPVLIICATDGQPAGEDRQTLARVVVNASRMLGQTRYGSDALSLQIAQIGNDQKARAFLDELDVHPEVGGLIDCTSNYENEEDNFRRTTGQELTPELWLMKLLLGACDSSYDLKDE